MKVFIDTGIFIAYFIAGERDHKDVTEKYRYYRKNKVTFYTSDYILDELYTWLVYNLPASTVGKLIDHLEQVEKLGEVRVLGVDVPLRQQALLIFRKFSDHKLSFTDATTVALVKQYHFDELFTLDSDFAKVGLRNLSF